MKSKSLIYKVITWRLISIILTLTMLYLFTGDIKSSSGITVMLHLVLTCSHFVFERAWEDMLLYVDGDKHDQ